MYIHIQDPLYSLMSHFRTVQRDYSIPKNSYTTYTEQSQSLISATLMKAFIAISTEKHVLFCA